MQLKIESKPMDLSIDEKIVAGNSECYKNENRQTFFLTNKNRLFKFDLLTKTQRLLKTLPEHLELDQPIDIHIYENFVVAVNRRNTNGWVVNVEDSNWELKLTRGDYHVGHCTFAIGFFKRDESVHLIHTTDWNRLDITDLESKKCITEREIKYSPNSEECINYLDYFHSSLITSPDESKFIVNGWIWSPYDVLFLWTIEDFLERFEPSFSRLKTLETTGYNWDRPVCFLDNETIAWAYNEREANEGLKNHASEVVVQRISDNEIISRTTIDLFQLTNCGEVTGELNYNQAHDALLVHGSKQPLIAVGRNGEIRVRSEFVPDTCSRTADVLTRFSDCEVEVAWLEQLNDATK